MMKKNKYPSVSTQVNRQFYENLKQRGHSESYILSMIQPNRRLEFSKDVFPLVTKTPNIFQKLFYLFK